MISLIQTLPIGNALRVHVNPPVGTARWRVLRKTDNNFSGHDDPTAAVVLDTARERVVLDSSKLANGTTYFYKPYALMGSTWIDGDAVGAVPDATLLDISVDALSIVRERLEMGLQAEINAGRLKHEYGRIPVLTAPPAFEDTRWPVVTVHLESDAPGQMGLGMDIVPDEFDDQDWIEHEGYLSDVRLLVVGWSLNPDERILIRKALKRVVIGNLPVFDDAGMIDVDPSFSDTEDFQSYSAPVYQSVCQITCMAPSAVSATVGAIDDITVIATTI